MTLNQAKIILDLGETENIETIKRAYRKMALKYHPDRYQTLSEQAWATKQFIKVREAFDLLMSSAMTTDENILKEDTYFREGKPFQGKDTTEETEINNDFFTKPSSLFDRVYDKISNDKSIIGFILYFFVLIPEIVWFFNMIWWTILQGIFERIGVEIKLGSGSTLKHRLTYLFIQTLAFATYIPFPWLVALEQGVITVSYTHLT
ncbi:MAG: DnaJ domain-containing protein, partial [Smithella sp.]|nr:DnaJ domain-containing protein [Smithella sp.]